MSTVVTSAHDPPSEHAIAPHWSTLAATATDRTRQAGADGAALGALELPDIGGVVATDPEAVVLGACAAGGV